MYEKLTELIASENYNEALYELQEEVLHIEERTPLEAGKLCVLEATLWEVLNDSTAEFEAIRKGFIYDPQNYELYYMLSLYYRNENINRSYLCAEMAYFYCDDEADREVILGDINALRKDPSMRVRDTSIVILSYNDLEIMRDCIASVENSIPSEHLEIIVVDNASTEEGLKSFLHECEKNAPCSFKLIENSENLGFSKGCNIGAAAAGGDNDIFFLNNDAVLMPTSLFFLRMGLYDNRNVGACSALSNSASLQEIPEDEILSAWGENRPDIGKAKEGIDTAADEIPLPWYRRAGYKNAIEIFKTYARFKAVPERNAYLKCFRLTGFALLLSRDAIDAVAPDMKVFDEFFSPAYFEDDDLGIRIARAGFDQYLCTNSLIYHNGGSGFMGNNELMEISRNKFRDKWGFDIWGYSVPDEDVVNKVISFAKEEKRSLKIIDFSCGLGATDALLKISLPDSFVAGVCRTPFEAGIAARIADEVAFGDMNTMRIPWKRHSFDVVIIEKGAVNQGMISECLCEGGICIEQEVSE